jgi:signal transduction histidine kinase
MTQGGMNHEPSTRSASAMARSLTIRWRMVGLFCVTAGLLLGVCYAGFYLLFQRVVREQLDARLNQIAGPIIADISGEPEDKDVDLLNIPDEYFEVLDKSGAVLQRSKNLHVNLPLAAAAGLQTVFIPDEGEIRVSVIPFQAGEETWLFVAGESTRAVDSALATLRHFALALLPISLAGTAIIFGFYSNNLLNRIDAVVRQLRQFVSDASHELRTPLSVLRGETGLLLSKPRTPVEYETAARIMDSELKKLSQIVDSLFTLSMADAGQLRIAREPLYLEEVLDESCGLAAGLANQKKIQIERNIERDVLFHGDPTFLRQLFLIFLDNAIKYSPAGKKITVTLKKGNGILIRFRDEGIGIKKEDQPRIFERFFRAAPSGENHSGGLGLSIAQAIVQAHHGTIECESAPGAGSTFTIGLPLETST